MLPGRKIAYKLKKHFMQDAIASGKSKRSSKNLPYSSQSECQCTAISALSIGSVSREPSKTSQSARDVAQQAGPREDVAAEHKQAGKQTSSGSDKQRERTLCKQDRLPKRRLTLRDDDIIPRHKIETQHRKAQRMTYNSAHSDAEHNSRQSRCAHSQRKPEMRRCTQASC